MLNSVQVDRLATTTTVVMFAHGVVTGIGVMVSTEQCQDTSRSTCYNYDCGYVCSWRGNRYRRHGEYRKSVRILVDRLATITMVVMFVPGLGTGIDVMVSTEQVSG